MKRNSHIKYIHKAHLCDIYDGLLYPHIDINKHYKTLDIKQHMVVNLLLLRKIISLKEECIDIFSYSRNLSKFDLKV